MTAETADQIVGPAGDVVVVTVRALLELPRVVRIVPLVVADRKVAPIEGLPRAARRAEQVPSVVDLAVVRGADRATAILRHRRVRMWGPTGRPGPHSGPPLSVPFGGGFFNVEYPEE